MYEDTDQTISLWAGAAGGRVGRAGRWRPGAWAQDRIDRAGGPTLWFSTSTIPTWPGAAATSGSTNIFRRRTKACEDRAYRGVKLVEDCALCARVAIVSRYRKVVARIAGKAVI